MYYDNAAEWVLHCEVSMTTLDSADFGKHSGQQVLLLSYCILQRGSIHSIFSANVTCDFANVDMRYASVVYGIN